MGFDAARFSNLDDECLSPEISGLDDGFDQVIANIPDSIVRAADDYIMDSEFSADPLSPLLKLRDEHGYIVRGDSEKFGGLELPNSFAIDRKATPNFIVMGCEEADEILKQEQIFQNSGAYGLLGQAQGMAHGEHKGTIPAEEDGNSHDELRALYDTILNHKTMGERSVNLISPICIWLIERLIAKLNRGEEACLCRDIAIPLTYKAMTTLLGIGTSKLPEFMNYGEKLFSAAIHPEEAAIGADHLYDFWLEEVKKHHFDPKKDLITYLISAEMDGERALNDEEIAIAARFILIGGIDTTWRGLSLMLHSMLSHPKQYRDVCKDPKKLARKAVEETIRYSPSGFIVPRLASQDMTIAGVDIPAGGHLTLLQGVINRDPRRWENPNSFDVHRKFKPNRTFGAGTHACAGQHLARLEMITVLELFCEHLPDIKLAVAPEEIDVRGFGIRAPLRLPVTL